MGMRIECSRVILRELRISDSEDMFEYTCIPEVSEYLAWKPHTSQLQDREYIEKAVKSSGADSFYWGIALKSTGKLIGCVHVYNISRKHKRAEISYILNPGFSGSGYMAEAVREVICWLFENGYRRVQALCVDGHLKSEKLMIRCGMNYEGLLRKYALLKDGKSYDMKLYSICREDMPG